ncbi:hypothetical protein Clacol_000234 [Clathrus columnatus]|uniref:Uncharacterized protein n=1 Tax=Clathrus columnatus TaxID=1419009 RepID=A0AAV4ZWB5_9AGAM|nr:hypothetical protein Clacol_000234 [Clathrus columnatus]
MTSSAVTSTMKIESDSNVSQESESRQPAIVFDKGPRALATLFGGFFASIATFGYVNAFGVYQDLYTRSGVASPSAISWIGSTQLFFMFAMGLVGGLGLGIGGGLIYIPTLAIQSHYWRRHRALALGVVATGSSFGGVIFPIMLNRLINGSVGYAWGVRASAFLVLGLLILSNILMSPNQAISSKREKPDIKGVLTDVPFMLGSFACSPFCMV